MNLRNVLRAYSLLRVLSDDEAALLETLRAANDNERQLIADAMSDKPQKKSSKKAGGRSKGCTWTLSEGVPCRLPANHSFHTDRKNPDYHQFQSSSKSTRASGMAAQLNKQLGNRAQSLTQPPAAATASNDDDTIPRCQAKRPDGRICMLLPDHNIHHMKTANEYHEFQPAEQAAATSGD